LVAVVVALPVWVLMLGTMADVGLLFLVRTRLQAAVDMAALAAVQDVDLDRLASGERYIRPDAAARDGRRWARMNVDVGLQGIVEQDSFEVDVQVLNASPEEPLAHPVTRRVLVDPTVIVTARARMRLPFLGLVRGPVQVSARADAAVKERES